jgi:hypothetical protein
MYLTVYVNSVTPTVLVPKEQLRRTFYYVREIATLQDFKPNGTTSNRGNLTRSFVTWRGLT